MAKGKRVSHTGPHKSHGPKRNMFRELKPMKHVFAKDGLLNKYNCEESFILACQARNKKNVSHDDWNSFLKLETVAKKDAYFKSLRVSK